jgi:hypothetical protein
MTYFQTIKSNDMETIIEQQISLYKTPEERLEILTTACIRYEKEIETLSTACKILFEKLDKLTNTTNQTKTLGQNLDNPIIVTIKNVYQLEDYEYKDKVLTVYLIEFDEFIDKLYLHRIKGNLDGLSSGSKVIFKVDGDRIKDFRPVKNII